MRQASACLEDLDDQMDQTDGPGPSIMLSQKAGDLFWAVYISLLSLFLVNPWNTGPWRAHMGQLRGMTMEPRHTLFA